MQVQNLDSLETRLGSEKPPANIVNQDTEPLYQFNSSETLNQLNISCLTLVKVAINIIPGELNE
jgi:hypothetical protein